MKIDKQHCNDCGIDTYLNDKDYYMVTCDVWNKYGLGNSEWDEKIKGWRGESGVLCMDCLEKRMGRFLRKEDLMDVPVNKWNPYVMNILYENQS